MKKLFFYWTASFSIAALGYFLLHIILPERNVFGAWYRMFLYHDEHPTAYIAIPCFFYGIIAALFSGVFSTKTVLQRVFLTLFIIVLTIFVSSPFGGMLWCYHDMQAGYFPENWVGVMMKNGCTLGFELGWLIILGSIPYNILGAIATYFLTQKGSEWQD